MPGVALLDDQPLLPPAEVDHSRKVIEHGSGLGEVEVLGVLLGQMARGHMAEPLAQGLESSHAAEVAENGGVFRIDSHEQVQGLIKEDVVAPGHDKQGRGAKDHPLGLRDVDGVVLHPLLDEMPGKEPLPGDLGGREAFLGDQPVDVLLVDSEQGGHFLGGEQGSHDLDLRCEMQARALSGRHETAAHGP